MFVFVFCANNKHQMVSYARRQISPLLPQVYKNLPRIENDSELTGHLHFCQQ